MSWTDEDPGQGNPDGLLALAADLQADADDAASAARMLRGVQNNASDAVWKGTSADAFRDRIDKVPGHLDKLNASYAGAAAGIRSYAASVRQIADDARMQQQIVSKSGGELQTAQAQQAAWTPPPHPATGQPDPAAKNPHDDQVAAANASLKKAQAQLHDLAGQRQTADGRLVSALNHAHGEGMKNKHWWQKALDFASEALSKITIVLMVVALVAIVVLAIVQPELIPGLLLLAGQVLTGLSAAQLAVDGARKASGENVSWGSLGIDALGLLPGVGKLGKLADGVPLLSRGVEMLNRGSAAVRDFGVAGKAFVGSFGKDLAATRYVVAMATRSDGALMPVLLKDGKGFGQMLSDAKGAAKAVGEHEPQWLKNVRAGNEFNKANYPRYPVNEVHLENGKILDSYRPGEQIVSRKYTQLAQVKESTAFHYIDEVGAKYSPGEVIADTPRNRDLYPELVGKPLEGVPRLEIPVQNAPIPQTILDRAADQGVKIVDINGKIYR